MADKWLCILTYMQQNPIQAVQGQLLGMSQSNANTWIHLLQTVVNQALAPQDLLPARTAAEVAALRATQQAKEVPTPPLVGMRVLNGQSTARKIPRISRRVPVARRSARRSNTSS
jgi:hypothetical protein